MKKYITFIIISSALISCSKKNTCSPDKTNTTPALTQQNYGPFGKISYWTCIGGDTLFTDTLSLTYSYTEKVFPCNVCYYQQSISFWNDYSYIFSVSECAITNDTLIFTDIDSKKKTIFKRQN
jgi:hypothetical protein